MQGYARPSRSECLGLGLSLSLLALGLAACAADPMLEVRSAYYAGDYQGARERLVELGNEDSGNRHVYQLELGILDQALGQPGKAVQAMRRARDRMDALKGKGFGEWVGAMFLDDRQLDYEGADYEHVLVRAVLAIADLMNGGHDAGAYAFQVLDRQQEIIKSFEDEQGQKPKDAYKLVAFGSYLRAILNEENPRNRRIAAREFQKVVELEPGFAYGEADLRRAREGQHSAKGNGVVHILAMVGRGPSRVEVREHATRNVIMIAQAIWAYQHDRPFIPNIVPLPIPALAFHADNPAEVHVLVNGKACGVTASVTDVDETARAEFAAMRPYVMARAVIRRVLKTLIVEAGKEVVESGERRREPERKPGPERKPETQLVQVGLDILGNLWAASEGADLRCWSFLPQSFQVLRLELPAGDHEIALRAGRDGHPVGPEQMVRVRVRDGYNAYVLGICPTLGGGPKPLASHAPMVKDAKSQGGS